MKIFVFYSSKTLLNYNKLLLVDQFKRQIDLYQNNNFNINFCPFDDYIQFYHSLYKKITNNKQHYSNSIFWMHLKVGSYALTIKTFTNLLKELKIKTIFWMDDLHYAHDNMERDERYIHTDLIISPSTTYFENISSQYLYKTEFLFYYFDENFIEEYNPKKTLDGRKNQILLTGNITESYSSRQQMLINSYMNTDLYEVLKHPGYYNMTHKYYHKDYFNKLAEYKGSMVGLADYPLNFLLGKVIEVIGSGCIGFFEKSPLYEEKLGLKPWIHYVPVERNKYNKLILEDVSYRDLLQSDSGKKIAQTAYDHIKENYNSLTCSKKVIDILKRRFGDGMIK